MSLASMAADRFPALSRHWAVLRAAWSEETERAKTRTPIQETAFLPAALEVMETPPSPIGRGLLWFLMSCVLIALAWSFIGRMDVVAVAPGKLIPTGRIKTVQAQEMGMVRAVHVDDGSRVRRGDVLVELDPTVAEAELGQADRSLLSARVDAARARALLAGLEGRPARFQAPEGTPPEVARVQDTLIAASLAEVRARNAGLAQQGASAEAQASAARKEIAKLSETRPLLQQQVEARRALAEKGYQSKLQLLDYEAALVEASKNSDIARDTERQALAAVASARQGQAQVRQEAIREALAELSDAENRIAMASEDATKAGRRARLTRIVAPVTGTVQQMKLSTIGGVVQPAEALMVIIPDTGLAGGATASAAGGAAASAAGKGGAAPSSALVAEVMLLNKDIGFVRPGQDVAVKLEAFPFTDYGLIPGRLTAISRDAVEQEGVGLIYTGRVALDCTPSDAGTRRALQTKALCSQVAPGMAVTAEVKTGTRRIIDYFLSPIAKATQEAGRER